MIDEQEWEGLFKVYLKKLIKNSEFKVTAFIWNDLHDMHIISNLVGYQLENGLIQQKQKVKQPGPGLGAKTVAIFSVNLTQDHI